MSIISDEIKTIVGNLLMKADELTKRVLTAFDPAAKRTVNFKSLNSFNLDLLEPCATFLGIDLSDSDEHKLFTKESLINRIILGIRALLPSQCSDCNQQYIAEFDPEVDPLFTCHMCYQGSHDCETVKDLHSALGSTSTALLSGHVWLCSNCHSTGVPIKPRKSKSRHNSLTQNDALSRIRDKLLSQDIHSPANQSPEPISSGVDSVLRRDLQDEPSTHLQSLSRERICQKYKTGKCPHGIGGNKLVNDQKCDKEHPKRCFKFCRFGTKHKHGCKKGNSCDYFHPSLCKFSLQKRICTNKEFKYVHLKGTKRDEQSSSSSKENDRTSAVKVPPIIKNGKEEDSSEPDHFLELKRLVQSMQANFQQEISSIKASLHCNQPVIYPNYFNPHLLPPPPPPHQSAPLMNQYQQQHQQRIQPMTSVQIPAPCIPLSSF